MTQATQRINSSVCLLQHLVVACKRTNRDEYLQNVCPWSLPISLSLMHWLHEDDPRLVITIIIIITCIIIVAGIWLDFFFFHLSILPRKLSLTLFKSWWIPLWVLFHTCLKLGVLLKTWKQTFSMQSGTVSLQLHVGSKFDSRLATHYACAVACTQQVHACITAYKCLCIYSGTPL